ncbi:MAG: glycosyltransferase family 39 protein [Acidobacteriota bacterium]
MGSIISSVALVAVTAAGAWTLGGTVSGSGRLLRHSARWRFPHPALQIAAETAIGLLIISHLIFASVLLGLATRVFLYLLLLALTLLALTGLGRLDGADLRRRLLELRPRGALSWLFIGGCAAFAAWVVLLAQLPPIGFDSLVYHLEVPRQMLRDGGKVFFPDNIYAYFPQLGEMFFLFSLGIVGDSAAKLFHALFGALLALAIFGFARQHLDRRLSLMTAALFLTVPSVVQVLPFAYVDLTFSLFVFLAFAALLQYLDGRRLVWAVVAGIMAGGAWATKYTGMQVVFLFIVLLLIEQLLERRKKVSAAVFIIPAIAFSIFLPYMLRTWTVTGWPLFPFQTGGFSLHPGINWDVERSWYYLDFLNFYGLSGDTWKISDRLLAPILVFVKARFWKFDAYDGMIGPVFLLIPLLLWRRSKPKEIKLTIIFSLLYLYYWASTTLQARFLMPMLPPLAFLLAYGLRRRESKLLRGAIMVLMLVSLGFGVRENLTARPWNSTERPWAFWAGKESRDQFWERRIQIYPIYREANQRLGPNDVVYLADMRHIGYLLDCQWRADFIFQRWKLVRLLDASTSAADFAQRLLDRGITYLMIDELLTLAPDALDAHQRELLMKFFETRAELVARNRSWPASLWKIVGPEKDVGERH